MTDAHTTPAPLRRRALLQPIAGDRAEEMSAMDVVQMAAVGRIARPDFIDILSRWPFTPRTRELATRSLRAPDSLDAVDAAYFDEGLLTDDEYHAVLTAALA